MRKYNKEQKAYIEAKKELDILEAQEKKMEADFVKSLVIINEDGSVPFLSQHGPSTTTKPPTKRLKILESWLRNPGYGRSWLKQKKHSARRKKILYSMRFH